MHSTVVDEPQVHSLAGSFMGVAQAACSPSRNLSLAIDGNVSPSHFDIQDNALQTLGEVIAPQLFSLSLWPYLGFLYFLTKGRQASGAPNVMVGGFYFLLVFVFATIPAGIYAKNVYGTSLSNVDWLHGSAESMLTITNLLIGELRSAQFSLKTDQCPT